MLIDPCDGAGGEVAKLCIHLRRGRLGDSPRRMLQVVGAEDRPLAVVIDKDDDAGSGALEPKVGPLICSARWRARSSSGERGRVRATAGQF